jgi:hypothetical protein
MNLTADEMNTEFEREAAVGSSGAGGNSKAPPSAEGDFRNGGKA